MQVKVSVTDDYSEVGCSFCLRVLGHHEFVVSSSCYMTAPNRCAAFTGVQEPAAATLVASLCACEIGSSTDRGSSSYPADPSAPLYSRSLSSGTSAEPEKDTMVATCNYTGD